jgi:hypothetical protein
MHFVLVPLGGQDAVEQAFFVGGDEEKEKDDDDGEDNVGMPGLHWRELGGGGCAYTGAVKLPRSEGMGARPRAARGRNRAGAHGQ